MLGLGHGLRPAAVAQADEDRRLDVHHDNIGHRDTFHAGAVHHLQRDAGGRLALPEVGPGEHGAVAHGDVLEVAAGFGAQLETVAGGGEHAVGDGEILRGAAVAEREAGLGHNGVVPGFDVAIGDADMVAAIGINAVAIAVEDGHAFDVHVIAAQQADVVIGRIANRDVAHRDVAAILQRDRLGAVALGPVAVNGAGTDDPDMFHVLRPHQRVVEIGRLVVGEGLEIQLLVGIEVLLVRAGDQRGAGIQEERDLAFEPHRAGQVFAGREIDRPTERRRQHQWPPESLWCPWRVRRPGRRTAAH